MHWSAISLPIFICFSIIYAQEPKEIFEKRISNLEQIHKSHEMQLASIERFQDNQKQTLIQLKIEMEDIENFLERTEGILDKKLLESRQPSLQKNLTPQEIETLLQLENTLTELENLIEEEYPEFSRNTSEYTLFDFLLLIAIGVILWKAYKSRSSY